jgi:hypothetical protein
LAEIYAIRDKFRLHVFRGSYTTEAVNSRYRMFNFDELKVAYEPPPGVTFAPVASGDASIPSEGKCHQNFTLGLCTTAAGDKLIPMFIFTGAIQLCDGS